MRIDAQKVCGKIKYIVAKADKILRICDTYKEAQDTKIALSL